MLILEEVKEMLFLEAFLRKFRFDVQSIKTNVAVMDKYLSFRPDLIIVTARGQKINGIDLAKKINPKHENVKIFLSISSAQKVKPTDLKDLVVAGYIESPTNPMKCLEMIAQHLKLDLNSLKESFEKQGKASEKTKDSSGPTWVKGGKSTEEAIEVKSRETASKVESKYLKNKFLDFDEPKQQKLDRERIQKEMGRIRKEGEEPELDEARKEFVRQLYKK